MRDARMMRTLMVRASSVTDDGLFCGIQAWTVDTGDRGQKVQLWLMVHSLTSL